MFYVRCFQVFKNTRIYLPLKMALKEKKSAIDTSLKPFRSSSTSAKQKAQNGLTTSEDFSSALSTEDNKSFLHRSSMICSEGFDKYTYDCHRDDIPQRSIGLELDSEYACNSSRVPSSEVPTIGNDDKYWKSSLVKRDSVVHPGKFDVQRSVCVNNRFRNPWPTWQPPTVTNILKFGLSKDKSNVPSKQELDLVLPVIKPDFSKHTRTSEDGIVVTWLGHSTVLVKLHGLNILTDPIFSDRASPSQVVGPKRYRDPPCSIHDLPHIDAVLVSHSHYDHLDLNTVRLLNARFDTGIRWFVPLGLRQWMCDMGCENVVELDWWEENCVPEHSDITFVFTPAQHWSKRTLTDDYKVLWGSWCVIGPKCRFFFAGDTGYCEAFKQIGHVYGPFDISAIPIGAYEPRWFMKYQHVNPEEAVKIHLDVRSKCSLAIHWGTFSLANEYYLDPPRHLRKALDQYDIHAKKFFTLRHGETRLIPSDHIHQHR